MDQKNIDPQLLADRGPDMLKILDEVPLQKGYTGHTDMLRSMSVGQSLVVSDSTIFRLSSLCSQLRKRLGHRYRCRSMDNGSVKVYRVK
jgi:hypothetical protein